MSDSIEIKDYKILANLLLHPYAWKLVDLVIWVIIRYSKVIFTSAYREGDPGVHGTKPCRGLDIRSNVYDNPQGVAGDINEHWQYDPERPEKRCAIFHDVGRGPHIHLQVHPRTKHLGG